MSQYVQKQKSSSTEENLIVDLSAIPPQSETEQPEDPLAGLMPLPPDTPAKESATKDANPLAGLVSPPPDGGSSKTDSTGEDSSNNAALTGVLPPQPSPTGKDGGEKK